MVVRQYFELVAGFVPDKGSIVAIGGTEFMRGLIAMGLIDEYHLAIHPVSLGTGLQIFSGLEIPLYLKLVDLTFSREES